MVRMSIERLSEVPFARADAMGVSHPEQEPGPLGQILCPGSGRDRGNFCSSQEEQGQDLGVILYHPHMAGEVEGICFPLASVLLSHGACQVLCGERLCVTRLPCTLCF